MMCVQAHAGCTVMLLQIYKVGVTEFHPMSQQQLQTDVQGQRIALCYIKIVRYV